MLYRLEIENFASIREAQALDLRIGGAVSDTSRFGEIFPGAATYAPRVIGIYGANASGKTNVLSALAFLLEMATSFEGRSTFLPFNSLDSMEKPTRLAIEFGDHMDPLHPDEPDFGIYRYELQFQFEDDLGPRILAESLRRKPRAEGKWHRVLERNAEGSVKGSDTFPMQGYSHLVKTLRPNATVLASFAYFNHPAAKFFNEMAKSAVLLTYVLGPDVERDLHKLLSTNPDLLSTLNEHLSRIDFGLESMHYADTKDGPRALFKHQGLTADMNWSFESHGTRSFIRMFPFIEKALATGAVCLIDELDSAIHPLLLPEIIRWFQDGESRNPLQSQLWFTSHSPTLLEDLQKEEVVLCEKDRQGQTSIYSLMDVKVRRDENLFRKYMSGAYGGVPLLG